MKKFFVLLLVLCLAFAGVVTYISYSPMPIADEAVLDAAPAYEGETLGETEAAPAEDEAAAEPAAPSYKGLDYEKILALHNEEDVVATVGGEDISWREYYYWLFIQANQIDGYFAQMAAYYGLQPDWNEMATEDMNFAQLTNQNAEYMLRQVRAIASFAQENGVELTDEDKAGIAAQLESDMTAMLGEGADEAAFNEYLLQAHLDRDIYDRLNRAEYLMTRSFAQLYGNQGELVDEADAVAYLTDKGYINANHILYMSIDPATGEALDDAAKAEKLEKAQALAAELAAIEDSAELVERFNSIKAEVCEDSGKVQFPEGYTFTTGTMVPEFEAACLALEDYKVSDVVETSYGYHVIIRLPLQADSMVLSTDGQASTGRLLFANNDFTAAMNAKVDEFALEYAEGFEAVNVADYVIK